jgi:hypothetical protein
MRQLVFLILLLGSSVCSVGQQTTQPDQEGIVQRGDHVMGFSRETTTHHFHLLKDGGEIVVTANDANEEFQRAHADS